MAIINDAMQIEILEDGTIKITTDKISGANHRTADQFLQDVVRSMGGQVEAVSNRGEHAHVHTHEHEHVHAGGHRHSHK